MSTSGNPFSLNLTHRGGTENALLQQVGAGSEVERTTPKHLLQHLGEVLNLSGTGPHQLQAGVKSSALFRGVVVTHRS